MDELNQTYTTPEGSVEEVNVAADNQMQNQPENQVETPAENQEDNYIEISAEVIRNEIKKAKKKGTLKGCLITVGIVLLILLSALLGYIFNNIRRGTVPFGVFSFASSGIIDNDVLKKSEGLYAMIENGYLYDVDKETIKDGVYKGMVDALGDPYSVYYTKEEFDEMMESSSGSFEGIGCYMYQDPDTMQVLVQKPMKNSPAEEAGLKTDDIIMTVDDEDVSKQDINLVVSKIRGPKGTTVKIGVKRGNEPDIIEFTIRRDVVYEQSVDGGMLSEMLEDNEYKEEYKADGVGYIYLTEFADDTANQFRDKLNELKDKGATSLIIDLRDNGGGYVDVCTEIADMILPECNIVSTKDKHGITEKIDATDEEYLRIPIVVLVNENSASASEILTGALKDNDYATVIGEKTFGKGIVQEVVPLNDGSGIKLTICQYFTPSGECIHEIGIEPDIVVELDYDKYIETGFDNQIQAACDYLNE